MSLEHELEKEALRKQKMREYQAAYRARYPERCREANKRWRIKNLSTIKEYFKLHARRHNLKKSYGLSLADYDAMLIVQNGKCKICETGNPGRSKVFHVDHDHYTGRIRGLLCSRCNTGLGQFRDNITFLQRAQLYLNESRTDA